MIDESLPINGITGLVIENKIVFSKLVQSLYDYTPNNHDIKLFNDKYESLKLDELVVITDILGYDVNSAAVIKLLYSDLENQIADNPELHTEIEDTLGKIVSLIVKETLDFEPDLHFSELTMQKIFKALDIKIETSNLTIFERTSDIIRVFKYLRKKKLLVIINLGTYLSHQQILETIEFASLQNINMLLIDIAVFDTPKNLTQYVMDNDFVVMKRNTATVIKTPLLHH